MDCQLLARARQAPPVKSRDFDAVVGAVAAPCASARSLASGGFPVQLLNATALRGTGHHRRQVERLGLDLRHFAAPAITVHSIAGRRALILIALQGASEVKGGSLRLTGPAGVPVLYSDDGPAEVAWSAQSWGLAIDMPRDGLNAAASTALGDARRLASTSCVLAEPAENEGFDTALGRLVALIAGSDGPARGDNAVIETEFFQQLAARLIAQRSNTLLLPVRSVGEAMRIIREDHRRDFDTEALAARVGVTAQTLRKGFRSCLGLSVKAFIEAARLDWAHGTLSSTFDGRSIDAIAKDAGFSGAPPFSRAYVKRFGEAPSLTRARAVHAATG